MNYLRWMLFAAATACTGCSGGCGSNVAIIVNARPDSMTTQEDASVTIDVLANDQLQSDKELSVVLVRKPTHGKAKLLGKGQIQYSPDPGFHGRDEFTYRLGEAGPSAMVSVDVSHVNHAPVANDDTIELREGVPFIWNLARKGTDVDGDVLTVTDLGIPTNGSVRTTDGHSVIYTPDPRFDGSDSFQYSLSDGKLVSSRATVKVRVLPGAPRFWRTERLASFGEMLLEPGTSIYGSSISIWAYQNSLGQSEQIIVTGHADSSTCRNVSSLLYNAFLQKHREPEDLLTAGAGFLQKRGDTKLRQKLAGTEAVRNYVRLEVDLAVARVRLRFVETDKTPDEDGKSAIKQANDEVKRLEQAFTELSQKEDVKQYLAQTKSGAAMDRFIANAERVAGETGLVKVHRLDAGLGSRVAERIDEALSLGRETDYIRFDDLTKGPKATNGVIIVPVRILKTRSPLVLKLPLDKLDPAALQKSLEESRQEITHTMVGNAKIRLDYLNQKRKELADRLEGYRKLLMSLSLEERAIKRKEKVTLSQNFGPDGEYISNRPIDITFGEYVDFRLPQNLRVLDLWVTETRDLLEAIEQDARLKDLGAIEQIAYCTMVDSMLRGWDLPVARSQRAFNQWRGKQRESVWDALNEMLRANGIAKDAIGGENVVFSVNVDQKSIVIRPLHIVDLKNSVILLDPRLGVSRVVDRWAERTEEKSGSDAAQVRDERARNSVTEITKALRIGNLSRAEQLWSSSCEANARIAVESLLKEWAHEFPSQTSLMHRLRAEIMPRIAAQELLAEWERIHSNPKFKEKDTPGEYLLAVYHFLETNPSSPPEMHLRFLQDLAEWIAVAEKQISKRDMTRWDVLDGLITNASEGDGEEGPFYEARLLVSKALLSGKDPATLLREVANLARRCDERFTEDALKNHSRPGTQSESLRRLNQQTNRALTEFEFDALRLEKIQQMMRSRAHADLAATILLRDDLPPIKKALQHVRDALATELGSQNAPFRAAQHKLEAALNLPGSINRLQTEEIVGALENGERLLLRHSENTMREEAGYRGVLQIALMQARLGFEFGDYNKSLDRLFDDRVALALYHPELDWAALSGDWTGRPLGLRTQLTNVGVLRVEALRPSQLYTVLSFPMPVFLSSLIANPDFAADSSLATVCDNILKLLQLKGVVKALAPNTVNRWLSLSIWARIGLTGPPQLVSRNGTVSLIVKVAARYCAVLELTGLPPDTRRDLKKVIDESRPQVWASAGRVSEQVLLMTVHGRPILTAYRDFLRLPAVKNSLIKAMVYGSILPEAKSFPGSGRWLETSQSRPIYDRLLNETGAKVSVPAFDELIQKIKSGKIVKDLLPPEPKSITKQ